MAGRRAYGGVNRRHEAAQIDPSQAISLAVDHPAVRERRTIFPTTVVPSAMSPRFLVSGANNPKLGKEMLKGPRAGWPIYHLTPEERATCPRACEQYLGCYGNAMHRARRHAVDEFFEWLLKAEVVTLARQHDDGFLVRLHTLGDFYSARYVELWGKLLEACPSLHVFGFTARHPLSDDPLDREIAASIAEVEARVGWERFAIRLSSSSAPAGRPAAVVVDDVPTNGAILCPAQRDHIVGLEVSGKGTESCATCALCWTAPTKTIAFMRHGMRRLNRAPSLASRPAPSSPLPRQPLNSSREIDAHVLKVLASRGAVARIPVRNLAAEAGMSVGAVQRALLRLEASRRIEVARGITHQGHTYRILASGHSQVAA